MKALILAAGLGTRLRPLTNDRPKVMIELLGKPVLEWQIEWLKKFGIRDILINLHAFPQTITDYFGDGKKHGVKIIYKYEPVLLGTAGTIKNFQKHLDRPFLVIYGDVPHRVDLARLIKYHREKKGEMSLVVGKPDRLEDADLLGINSDNKITAWYPKPHRKLPKTKFSNEALYLMNPKIIDYIPSQEPPIDIGKDVMKILIGNKVLIYGYFLAKDEYIEDMGTLKRLEKVKKEFAKFLI